MIFILSSIGLYFALWWRKKVKNSGGGTGSIMSYYGSALVSIICGIGQLIGLYLICV